MLGTTLLIAGLIFPTLSLLTCIAAFATSRKHGRHVSPVFIPVVGPVLLTCWVFIAGHTRWLVPFVWLLDLGTMACVVVFPRLVGEWWQISAFTRLVKLHGANGIEEAVLSLHRGGHYFLRKSWNRPQGEPGIVGLGETGTFIDDGEVVALKSHHGLSRQLQRIDVNAYDVSEPADNRPEFRDYSLHGWRLNCYTMANEIN